MPTDRQNSRGKRDRLCWAASDTQLHRLPADVRPVGEARCVSSACRHPVACPRVLRRAIYGSSLMKALTTIAEFLDASFSKTSFWFWSGSAPAISERLRKAMNGLLLI